MYLRPWLSLRTFRQRQALAAVEIAALRQRQAALSCAGTAAASACRSNPGGDPPSVAIRVALRCRHDGSALRTARARVSICLPLCCACSGVYLTCACLCVRAARGTPAARPRFARGACHQGPAKRQPTGRGCCCGCSCGCCGGGGCGGGGGCRRWLSDRSRARRSATDSSEAGGGGEFAALSASDRGRLASWLMPGQHRAEMDGRHRTGGRPPALTPIAAAAHAGINAHTTRTVAQFGSPILCHC